MLHCLADRPSFSMEKGRARAAPALLWDATGAAWPACSLLAMPFERAGEQAEGVRVGARARAWFGDEYAFRQGSVQLPPRNLSRWKPLGHCTRIAFVRRGDYPGPKGRHTHPFGDQTSGVLRALMGGKPVLGFRKDALPVLYELGPALRLELGPGCVLSREGIVFP